MYVVVVSVESLWNIFRRARYFRTNEGTFVHTFAYYLRTEVLSYESIYGL